MQLSLNKITSITIIDYQFNTYDNAISEIDLYTVM